MSCLHTAHGFQHCSRVDGSGEALESYVCQTARDGCITIFDPVDSTAGEKHFPVSSGVTLVSFLHMPSVVYCVKNKYFLWPHDVSRVSPLERVILLWWSLPECIPTPASQLPTLSGSVLMSCFCLVYAHTHTHGHVHASGTPRCWRASWRSSSRYSRTLARLSRGKT